jgi:AcrR family transcriptional regulator
MFKEAAVRAVPQRATSEETRRLVLDTALRLFRERGLDETTMRDVAAAAGLSLGAAYYYFRNKEAIVGAYYDYVQEEHLARAREGFAKTADLHERLRIALHTKVDILRDDQRLLSALFRYGGDPRHPLSWFGPGTRHQRELSIAVFAEALAGERLPDDLQAAAPTVLWTLHMGILLYFLYDESGNQRRTRALVDASIDFVVLARRFVTNPLLKPLRRRVVSVLQDAGLLAAEAGPS